MKILMLEIKNILFAVRSETIFSKKIAKKTLTRIKTGKGL